MLNNTNIPEIATVDTLSSSKPNDGENFLSHPRYQVMLPSVVKVVNSEVKTRVLPSTFQPGEYDVICGRGKGSYNRPGNRRLHGIIQLRIPEYKAAKTKLDKSAIFNAIIDEVRQQNNGTGRFIRKDKKNGWIEIGDDQAREKVGHAVREAINAMEIQRKKKEANKMIAEKQGDLLSRQKEMFQQMMESKIVGAIVPI